MSSDEQSGLIDVAGAGIPDTVKAAPPSQCSDQAERLQQETERQIVESPATKVYEQCLNKKTPKYWKEKIERLVKDASIGQSQVIEALNAKHMLLQQLLAKQVGQNTLSTSVCTQTELKTIQDMGTQIENEEQAETLHQEVDQKIAKDRATTSSDQCLNENSPEFWEKEIQRQIEVVLTENDQTMENLKVLNLLLQHDLDKQSRKMVQSESTSTQTELKIVTDFGIQTEAGGPFQLQTSAVVDPTDSVVSEVTLVGNNEQELFEQFHDRSRSQSRMEHDFEHEPLFIPQNSNDSLDELEHGDDNANEQMETGKQEERIEADREDPQQIFRNSPENTETKDESSENGDDDTDEQDPPEPSVSSKTKKMKKLGKTTQKRGTAQFLTGNNVHQISNVKEEEMKDEELAKHIQLSEFSLRDRRPQTSLAQKRDPSESLPNNSKKMKADHVFDSPNNEKIEWHTLKVISSNIVSRTVRVSVKVMEELKKLTAPTNEEYSERIHYRGDVFYEELKRKLARICIVDNLQGIEEEDEDGTDGESEAEAENAVKNDKAVQRKKKRARRRLNITKNHVSKTAPSKVVPLLFTSALKPECIDQNGQRIVEIAEESLVAGANNSNGIYTSENVLGFNFFQQKRLARNFGGEGERLPITMLNYYDANLEDRAMSVSISLITYISLAVEQSGSDSFSDQALKLVLGENIIDVLRQRLTSEENGSSIVIDSHSEEMKFSDFLENFENVISTAQAGYEKIVSEYPIKKETVLELQQELNNVHRPNMEGKTKSPFSFLYFGTNFDIPEEAEDQQRIIRELHKWMQPGQGLMSHFPKVMPGITQAQAYFSEPGCRLSGRFESQGLGSVNINLGPDAYVWFAVPLKFIVKLEELFRKKNGNPYQSGICLNEEMLQEAGISYYKFEQKKGEIVVANTGIYYWIVSNGFARMISWNIMPATATQLAATALFCDHDVAHGFPTVLPFQKLLWEIARKKEYANSELSKLTKHLLIPCLAHCKMEFEKAKQEGWTIEIGSPALFETVIRCCERKCTRDTIFNMVFVEKYARQSDTRYVCLQCVRKTFINRPDKDKCYIRYPIEDLVKIFDEYN